MRFDELDLEDEVLDGIDAMNFQEMTPVQEQTIPIILDGRDIIACATDGYGQDGGLYAAAAEPAAARRQ